MTHSFTIDLQRRRNLGECLLHFLCFIYELHSYIKYLFYFHFRIQQGQEDLHHFLQNFIYRHIKLLLLNLGLLANMPI